MQVLTVIACLGFAAEAMAVHARPKAGTPVSIKLVPSFEECFGADSTHGAPLAIPSCNPPIQASAYLTMNAPDRVAPFNGASNASAVMLFRVSCLTPGTTTETGESPPCPTTGDQVDVKITFATTDIRCVGAPGQGNCAGGAASLYNGKLLLDVPLRLTDHNNTTTGQGCAATTTCPATTGITTWPIGIQCTGGFCNYTTSADSTIPGVMPEGKRSVIETGAIEVQDAGLNGNMTGAPAPSTGVCPPACAQDDAASTYLTQGLLLP